MIKRFLILLFSFNSFLFAQVSSSGLSYNSKEYHLTKKEERDPALLVNALIKGKSSDKEKFDAIYGWVVTNITYNYRLYYSSSGSFALPTKYILKNKRAVCLGYANLLDSLCSFAGITSVSVYGYAKDELFDVGDSLYADNHAWNAVRLDGLWYLCDVTWSTGTLDYEPTRFGKFLLSLHAKVPRKMKQKKIRNQLRVGSKDDCTASGPQEDVYYYKQKISNKLLRFFISLFKIRIKKTYTHTINTNHYLAQPEVFAIEHCPDNAIWALDAIKSISHFENDSAYYYLKDSVYEQQQRSGRDCPACDAYVAMSAKDRIRLDERADSAFNAKNQFAITSSEFSLARLNFTEAKKEFNDSIALMYVDSAQINSRKIKQSLQSSKKQVAIGTLLHKNKNKKKLRLLLSENKQHKLFIRKKVRQTMQETRVYNEIKNKSAALAHMYWKKKYHVKNTNTNFKTFEPSLSRKRKVYETKLKLENTETQLQHLYQEIADKEQAFDSIIENLSLNIWQQARGLDSLTLYFRNRTMLRRLEKDNYKKVVEDLRKKIILTEFNYKHSLNVLVYEPSVKASFLYAAVNKLVKQKNKLQRDCLRNYKDLVKSQEEPMSSYTDYINFVAGSITQDYCWLKTNFPRVISVTYGFNFLYQQQDEINWRVIIENNAEKKRYAFINAEIIRRYQKYNAIISHNLYANRIQAKDLRAYRKKLVKKIKLSKNQSAKSK